MAQVAEAAACMPSLLVLQDLHLLCPQEGSGGEPSAGPHQQAIVDWLAEQLHLLKGPQHGAPPWPGMHSHDSYVWSVQSQKNMQ